MKVTLSNDNDVQAKLNCIINNAPTEKYCGIASAEHEGHYGLWVDISGDGSDDDLTFHLYLCLNCLYDLRDEQIGESTDEHFTAENIEYVMARVARQIVLPAEWEGKISYVYEDAGTGLNEYFANYDGNIQI